MPDVPQDNVPTKRKRKRNPIIDVVVELFAPSLMGKTLNPRDGRRWGAISKDLKDRGATPEAIRERWAECQRRFNGPGAEALIKHWDALGKPASKAGKSVTKVSSGVDYDKAVRERRKRRRGND